MQVVRYLVDSGSQAPSKAKVVGASKGPGAGGPAWSVPEEFPGFNTVKKIYPNIHYENSNARIKK